MNIEIKAIEQFFLVMLFILLCKVVLWMKSYPGTTTQIRAIEQYFPVVLLIVLTSNSLDEFTLNVCPFIDGILQYSPMMLLVIKIKSCN